MNDYLVVWEINISADTPRDAAQRALEIQRDPNSTATVFRVLVEGGAAFDTTVDVGDDDPEEEP